MTREESIILAEELVREYAELEKIQKEISDVSSELHRPYTPPTRMARSELCNWYPIIGILISIPLLILSGIFYLSYFFKRFENQPGAGTALTISGVIFFLSIVIFIAIQIFGARWDDRKLEEYNESVDRVIASRKQKEASLRQRENELHQQMTDLQDHLRDSEALVPSDHRTSSDMQRVKSMLACGKAETLEEAIAVLSKTEDS